MEDRFKRADTVRPQFVCDSALSARSDMNDIELDDKDFEDGETGFDDGNASGRNIRDPGQPTESERREHMDTHRPTDHGASSV